MTKRILAVLMAMCMIFAVAGCGEKEVVVSDYGINYGDEEITDIEDDADTVVVEKNETSQTGGTTSTVTGSVSGSGSTGGSNSGKGNAVKHENNDKIKPQFGIVQEEKKSFLESVPKNLSGKEVTILAWWNQFDYEKKKLEKFTKETGIKVKWIYVSSEEYMQRLSSLKASGSAPDLACITTENYPTAIMQNYFQPLDAGKLSLDPDVFDLESMDKLKWNGKRYGSIIKGTTYITMGLMMYNADLFQKYGVKDPYTLWQENNWTWDTFVKTATDIQKKSGVAGVTAPYNGFRLVQTCGEDAVSIKGGKLANNTGSKTYRNALKWLNNLMLNGQYKIMDNSLQFDGFLSGKAAMLVNENWALQAGERFNNTSFALGYAPLPCPTKDIVIAADAQLWGFPVGSKNTDAAGYVLEYWHNPAFNETGYEIWLNDSVAAFCDWMWGQPKNFKVSAGVLEYGGDYNWSTIFYDCAASSSEKVDSQIDKWSGVIDANIKKIYKEFG